VKKLAYSLGVYLLKQHGSMVNQCDLNSIEDQSQTVNNPVILCYQLSRILTAPLWDDPARSRKCLESLSSQEQAAVDQSGIFWGIARRKQKDRL